MDNQASRRDTLNAPPCYYCRNEAEPGRIETDNNGPIVPCPICQQEPAR